jgi:hypothetical protein
LRLRAIRRLQSAKQAETATAEKKASEAAKPGRKKAETLGKSPAVRARPAAKKP